MVVKPMVLYMKTDKIWYNYFILHTQSSEHRNYFTYVCICVFILFRTSAPAAYGSSWTRGWIQPVAACLCHSHSDNESDPHLWLIPQFMATLGS